LRYWSRGPWRRSLVDRAWPSLRNNHARRRRLWRRRYWRCGRTRSKWSCRLNGWSGGRRRKHGSSGRRRRNRRRRRRGRWSCWPRWNNCRWSSLNHGRGGLLDHGSHDCRLRRWSNRSRSRRRDWRCWRRRWSHDRRRDHRLGDHRRRRCWPRRRCHRFFLLCNGFEHVPGTGDV